MLGFHTAGEGGYHRRPPPPKDFMPNLFQNATTSQPSRASEATRNNLRGSKFLKTKWRNISPELPPPPQKEQYPFPFLTKLIP